MRSQIPTLECVEREMGELIRAGAADNRHIRAAAEHHMAPEGRRVRARIALSSAQSLSLPRRNSVAIAACCELLHNASLVHDDLQDRDEERRGRPAVWRAFSDDVALCLGDLLISTAYAALARADVGSRLADLFSATNHAVAETIRGQISDRMATAGDLRDGDAYDHIAAAKSGPLLALPIVLSLLAAGRPDDCATARRAARAFALGYQIIDDLADAASDGDGRVNAVAVAAREADENVAAARRHCEMRALRHLDEAVVFSRLLPNGSGAALERFALTLGSEIGVRHAA